MQYQKSNDLMSGCLPRLVIQFKESMRILNAMGKCGQDGCWVNIKEMKEEMKHAVLSKLSMSEEEVQQHKEARVYITKLLFNVPSGFVPKQFVHLQNMDVQTESEGTVKDLEGLGTRCFVEYFMKEIGKKQCITFMCDGVACRLKDKDVLKKLEYFMKELGKKMKAFLRSLNTL